MENARKHAVVLLPPVQACPIRSKALRRWLSRTDFEQAPTTDGGFKRTLAALGLDAPGQGAGALRLWGQTAHRADGWVAAADALHLEASLNHLLARRLSTDELPVADLDEVYAELNARLGEDTGSDFFNIGRFGYLRSNVELQTATAPLEAIYGEDLASMLPTTADAASYHRLVSEVQMVLHEAQVQERRAAVGARPINALWIWGGGVAPPVQKATLPRLFASDPLLRGYWYSRSCPVDDWCGSVALCAERGDGSFVAEVPAPGDDTPETELTAQLDDIKILLDSGRLDAVTMLFRDGVTAHARRRFRWRWWRAQAPWVAADVSE